MFRVEFVEPFIKAAFAVVESVVNLRPTRGQLAIRSCLVTNQQLAVVLSVSGDIEGEVLYGMSVVTAQKLASSMLGNPVMCFDEVAQNTMEEFGNTIVSEARTYLGDTDFNCEFAPVLVARSADLLRMVQKEMPTLVVPMLTQFGRIEIDIALAERISADEKAA